MKSRFLLLLSVVFLALVPAALAQNNDAAGRLFDEDLRLPQLTGPAGGFEAPILSDDFNSSARITPMFGHIPDHADGLAWRA